MIGRNSAETNALLNSNPRINLTHSIKEESDSSRPLQRIVENFIVIWLDPNIQKFTEDFSEFIVQLRSIVNSISTFDDLNQCIECIKQPRSEKTIVIVSNILGQDLLRSIHRIAQLESVYVFGGSTSTNEAWTREWKKVKGVFTNIELLCESLRNDIRQSENDLTPITITSVTTTMTNATSDELDQSFMYSQILKEILLDMDHNDKAKGELVKFCREQYVGNKAELAVIDEFDQYYSRPSATENVERDRSPIWWYTRECFIYSMLNKALRTLDIEIIIKMGFFMQDIHRQIENLHLLAKTRDSFVVYRGQGMLNAEFEIMKKNIGGLLSFNSFLSTSTDRHVALYFAQNTRKNLDMTALLFQMTIDPSSLFAPLGTNISFFTDKEKEILFSMHTVFRIGGMKLINDRLWEVELKLTKDNDDQLKILTGHMRQEIGVGPGLGRIGSLLVKMGKFDKAEDIFTTLLKSTSKNDWPMLALLNNQFGYIAKQKGDLPTALTFYQKTLEIQLQHPLSDHINLATIYVNIGTIYDSMHEYSTALSYYRKALEIKQKTLSADDLSLATVYSNIALVHDALQDYPTAASFLKKTLDIQEKSLSSNHPSLATTYNNMGAVHRSMEDYETALSYYQKAYEIFQKSLPPNHPSLAIVCNNIGLMYDLKKEYSKALEYYQTTLEIKQRSLAPNHRSLAITYNNMAFVHKSMEHYSTALWFFEKALDIEQHSSPLNHQEIQNLKKQIDSLRGKR